MGYGALPQGLSAIDGASRFGKRHLQGTIGTTSTQYSGTGFGMSTDTSRGQSGAQGNFYRVMAKWVECQNSNGNRKVMPNVFGSLRCPMCGEDGKPLTQRRR